VTARPPATISLIRHRHSYFSDRDRRTWRNDLSERDSHDLLIQKDGSRILRNLQTILRSCENLAGPNN
jgi:hypothetical protein